MSSDYPTKMEMALENYFDDEIDVEVMVGDYPKFISIDVLEFGSYSKNVYVFRDDQGNVKLKITDFHSKMETVDGEVKYENEKTITLIREDGEESEL